MMSFVYDLVEFRMRMNSPDAPNGQTKSPHSSTGFVFFFLFNVNCDFFGVYPKRKSNN